jgi:basic amino acid/polyamine antiporter, APA family
VLYVEVFINMGHNKLITVLLVLVGLWIPAVINFSGVKNMSSVQMVTTVLKFAALAFMSTVGLFYIKSANFTSWNISSESAVAAVGGGMAIALFSYLDVEVTSVAAGKVRDPDRNVPKSTVFGTLATAVVYMLSLTAVFGLTFITGAGSLECSAVSCRFAGGSRQGCALQSLNVRGPALVGLGATGGGRGIKSRNFRI